ncbi:dienelactone hydrolase family protein [Roseateles amylovorans]|jgi:carboxymethylenebutenolidase|uniref:Dienelactone hydrolase family protein n=1 Tax=Roseateles amylovorans TaxID=2978473 RepID=A0ABY6B547_9BURK|nr:dienelactone hydrolase family protein [Roseateles amylovorans]UXH80506.1 dienelactone hydrolase family protein [Roseateles amylovorans]
MPPPIPPERPGRTAGQDDSDPPPQAVGRPLFKIELPHLSSRTESFDAYLALAAAPDAPGIVVIPEALGRDEDLPAMCQRWAADGFHALGPDLLWRHPRPPARPPAESATPPLPEAPVPPHPHYGFDVDQGVNDLQVAIDWLAGMDSSHGARRRVGCVGYGLGGVLSYRAAVYGRLDASVVYYATGVERFLDEVHTPDCPMLMHVAGKDEAASPGDRHRMAQTLSARPATQLYLYPQAPHGFARLAGPQREPAAADLADQRSRDFLARHLRQRQGARPGGEVR